MILHWFTTAWRSLLANPLFSAITIISLSVGCCGALLAGANIRQHLSFEHVHSQADRILIVTRGSVGADTMFVGSGPGSAPPVTTMRVDGPNGLRPNTFVSLPLKDVIAGQVPGIEAQTRLLYSSALFKSDQDELDRRNEAGPPAPGEPPRAPLPGTVFVDEDFFKVFPMDFLEGSSQGLQEPDAIIITRNRAERLFGNGPAVGKTVEGVKGHTLHIIGVVPTLPANTHMVFQTMAGLRTMQMVGNGIPPTVASDWARTFSGFHYVKIKNGVDVATFIPVAKTAIQAAGEVGMRQQPPDLPPGAVYRRAQETWSLVPLLASHLAGPQIINFSFAAAQAGDVNLIWTLAGGAIALMVVSSFNYVTLSLARSLRRRREVAVRKVLGASRGALIQQYLVESGIVTGISLVIGFAAAWFLHPWFARTISQPETLFDLLDPVFIGIALTIFVVLALTVGAYPAFYLAAVRPRTGLGEGGTASPGRIGQAVSAGLLGLQIAAAAGLLIVAATMGAQANYIATQGLGFSVKDRYQVAMNCSFQSMPTPEQMQMLARVCNGGARNVIEHTPGIQKAFYYGGTLISESVTTESIGRTAAGESIGRASRMSVDADFLQNMGTTLLAGRYFDSNSAYDRAFADFQKTMQARPQSPPGQPPPANLPPPPVVPKRVPVIVSKAILPALGAATPTEAIGKEFVFQPRQTTYTFEVVGVIEDWHQRPLKYEVNPVVFVPQNANNAVLMIEPGKVAEVQRTLRDEWRKAIDNPRAAVVLNDLEETLGNAYKADFRLMYALMSFAGVAIAVAGMGVYGLSAFEMRRRIREIGVRKALGATPTKVATMVIGRALGFAAVATVIAWPIGWWLSEQWLSSFVYRTSLGFIVLPAASLAIMAFVAIAVSINAFRAAAVRPSVALRPN